MNNLTAQARRVLLKLFLNFAYVALMGREELGIMAEKKEELIPVPVLSFRTNHKN